MLNEVQNQGSRVAQQRRVNALLQGRSPVRISVMFMSLNQGGVAYTLFLCPLSGSDVCAPIMGVCELPCVEGDR